MEQDCILRVSLVQLDIEWENKPGNLKHVYEYIAFKATETDIFVLPEMFSTGFTMNSRNLAETNNGETISTIKWWAAKYNVAICGSFIASDNGDFYNRGFFITPEREYFYDKRHLFRMGSEPEYFSSGDKRLILKYKGFNVCLLVCYDLRFPVWARNIDNEYDLLIYVANWPSSRAKVWDALLTARAIENMSYVCGVNRFGEDGNGIKYIGGSKMINARGEEMTSILKGEDVETVSISKTELEKFRKKFPVWKDADKFQII